MAVYDKRFTFLLGSPINGQLGASFNTIHRNDSNGVPMYMYEKIDAGIVQERDFLYHSAEEVLRKTIDASAPNQSGERVVYVGDMLYSEELVISSANTLVCDKLETINSHISMINKDTKDVVSGKLLRDILSEHYIDAVYVHRNFSIPMYGRRDMICIHFNDNITRLENLDENNPKRCTYMNNLVDFFKVIKDMILA